MPATTPSNRRPRVLLVDDDPRLLMALGECLRSHRTDLDVDTSFSGTAALERIEATDFDVVVTDVRMAGIDGLALLPRIRALRPACITMLITGVEERDLALRALRAGAYDLLQKPVQLDDFVASVTRAVETRQLRRRNEEQTTELARHAEELERKLAKALEAGTRELREANRMKDEFFAIMSHELRTPLTAVLGWVRLLRSHRLEPTDQAQALASIERNGTSLAQLIDDLLDVSRIITGKLRLTKARVDVISLVTFALETVAPVAEAKGVVLGRAPAPEPRLVSGDLERLRQVLWNLLSNAVKFTPSGGRVRIDVEGDDSSVRIRISDSGAGIRPEFLPHVFDRFRQDDNEGRDSGLGLGLTIVRHLVGLHGGTIAATSEGEGKGATFTVTLPALTPADANHARPSRPLMTSRLDFDESAGSCLDGAKILVIDDEIEMRDLLTTMLRQSGAEVVAVGTAADARASFARSVPDLLLCDLGLPDEDGCALLSSLRALPPERGGVVPAVALTAYAGSDDRARALGAGFQLHVPKPGPANLPLLIAGLLERPHEDGTSAS